jgi:hypothetical protein
MYARVEGENFNNMQIRVTLEGAWPAENVGNKYAP